MQTKSEEVKYAETVLNWTLPGKRFYYRDTDEDFDVEKTYHIGQVLRAGFFIDMSARGKKPCSKIRYIIASSHASELYKTDMCNPFTKECELTVLHPNSFFKVMDIYKVDNQYQIFLLHIPMNGLSLMENAELSFNFGDEEGFDYLTKRARDSFDEKLKMEPDEQLETTKWKDRTTYPVGIMADGSPFDLEYFLPDEKQVADLEFSMRKIAEDLDPINLPISKEDEN